MKIIYYDVLPVTDGRWILRCAANGIIPFRSNEDETHDEFYARCARWCGEITKPERGRAALLRGNGEGL